MMEEKKQMTYGDLKKVMEQLATLNLADDTKVFLDTGWDSVQEIETESVSLEKAQVFNIEDPINGDVFEGYSLLEKAEKNNAAGPVEDVIILKHLY